MTNALGRLIHIGTRREKESSKQRKRQQQFHKSKCDEITAVLIQCQSLNRLARQDRQWLAGNFFHDHGGTVAKDLGHTLRDLSGIVTQSDHGIGPQSNGVLAKRFIGILSSTFAKIGVDGDIPANEGLQRRPDISNNASRPDNNPTNQTKMLSNAISIERESGRAQNGFSHSRAITESRKMRDAFPNLPYNSPRSVMRF